MISVIITGPESAGKSVLSKLLAEHFKGYLVQEYARFYIENLNRSYTFEDVENIARYQIKEYHSIHNTARQEDFVFFDTYLLITKIWFEEVFNICPLWLNDEILKCKPDYALLCSPDLPWESDGVRENGHRRLYLFEKYKKELQYYSVPFCIVEDLGEQRFQNAIACIDSFQKTKKSDI